MLIILLQLRRALSDIEELKNEDDYFFLRWLRSRYFNVNEAEWMIRKVSGSSLVNHYHLTSFLLPSQHMEVRKRLNVETLLTDYTPPEVSIYTASDAVILNGAVQGLSCMYAPILLQILAKYFPGGFFGEDREGHPVWYDNFGNLDPRGVH